MTTCPTCGSQVTAHYGPCAWRWAPVLCPVWQFYYGAWYVLWQLVWMWTPVLAG